jgi:hypothetical protein
MVIRTEYRGQLYSMGSSDPLPAGFEIRFGGLNFQATGNSYLMRLTNREELRAQRQARSAPVAAAHIATTPAPANTDVAGRLAPRRRRRSGQRSRQAWSERRHAACVASQRDVLTGETAAAPAGERSVSRPRFPIGLRGATVAYVANANANTTMCRVPPGRHVLVARDPSASAGDESSLGSIDELPPATSHGYVEWDFSGMPGPVMFRRFLDATDYWFGYSDDSSVESYDPARECCVVIANDLANAADATGAGDGEVPLALGTGPRMAAGRSAPPPSPPRGADINAQLAQARELEAKLAEEYRMLRLLRTSIAGEASARGERARELGRQARDRINTDFNVDDPDTPPRASQKLIAASALLRAMPTPSTPEARNLQRAAQAFIEQAAVQQAESSASRIRQQGSARDDGGAQGPEPSVHAGGAAERPANPGHTPAKKRLLDTRGQAQDGDARNVINARRASNAEARAAAGYHPRRVDATTTGRTAHRRRSPREPACSAGRSARRTSPSASASPRRSSSTTGRRIPVCGSMTTVWRVSWAGPPATRSSSVTSPAPRRLGADVARAPAGQPDPQLG